MSGQAVADPLDALAAEHGATIAAGNGPLDELAALHGSAISEQPNSSGALWMQGAAKVLPAADKTVRAALNAPNAPRVIQRAVGAAVRGASTAAGAAVGGVPGAVGGAAMSEGLTPTQQTVRGWLGRTASNAAASSAKASDAVVNYIEAMGADVTDLKGAALEYAKKAGRAILYDASGRASLVPAQSATTATTASAAKTAGSSLLGKVAKGLSVASGAQGVLDLAQMAEPDRTDIGFIGVGQTKPIPQDKLDGIYASAIENGIKNFGYSPSKAAAVIAKGDPKVFGDAMTAYMKSRMVK